MLDWIAEVYQMIQGIVQTVGTSLDNLVTSINNIQFDQENILYQYVGMVRYIVGDTLYIPMTIMISIGVLLSLYRLIIIVIDVIGNLIPGLKGRINVR